MNFPRGSVAPRLVSLILLFALAGLSTAHAGLFKLSSSASHKFITADQAFQMDTTVAGDKTVVHFHITPGYYLYRARFHFEPQTPSLKLAAPAFSRVGEWKDDPSFGRVEVYHEDVDVTLQATGSGDAKITWQGCADAGLCYPPQSQIVPLIGASPAEPVTAKPVATTPDTATSSSNATPPAVAEPAPANLPAAVTTAVADAATPTASSAPATTALPGFFHTSNKLGILAGMLLLGLGLSLTPCVWPMLPILSGIIARQHTQSATKGFLLSLAYVLGIATTYATMGALVGSLGAGANLPMWFQHPAVLTLFALLFVVLALSMFGLYELQLPHALNNRFDGLSRQLGAGGLLSSYVMGFFSALVVSPCISAPLAGVLLYISSTGNAAFGGLALFVLALGVGTPLLILGATEGRFLPKSGDWMVRVKIVMGLMLLGVAIVLIGRVLPGPFSLLLWAALATVTAVWLGALEPVQPGPGHLWKGLGVLLLIYGAVLTIGAATGNDDPLQPLARFSTSAQATAAPAFRPVGSVQELEAALAAASAGHQTVMLDFYADWCTSCKIMEREVFPAPAIATTLRPLLLLRADVTANSRDDQALLQHFGLFGPPSILFFRDGQELNATRVQGEMNADEFLTHVRNHVLAGE